MCSQPDFVRHRLVGFASINQVHCEVWYWSSLQGKRPGWWEDGTDVEVQEMLPQFRHRRWKTSGWLMESLWTHRTFCQKPKLRTTLVWFSFFTQIINLALKFTCIIFAAEGVLLGGVSDMLSAPTYPLLTINKPASFPTVAHCLLWIQILCSEM